MIDIEMLRIEKLIEEREEYENSFFSMEPKLNDELTLQFTYEIIQEPSDYKLELLEPFEDYFNNLRDEKLIEEREFYEIKYFKNLTKEIIEKDLLDCLIESYEEPNYLEFKFESFDDDFYDDYFEDYYVEEPVFVKKTCCDCNLDYMPNDNLFDNLDCYDYPEGPNENLNGIIFYF